MSTESGPFKSGWGYASLGKFFKWDQQVIFSWHIQFKLFVKKTASVFRFSFQFRRFGRVTRTTVDPLKKFTTPWFAIKELNSPPYFVSVISVIEY